MAIRREDALAYHASGRPGKIQVVPTKPSKDQPRLKGAANVLVFPDLNAANISP